MTPNEFIRAKRNCESHSPAELRWFVETLIADDMPQYQVAAWLMAAFLNGLNPDETSGLALAMAESGEVLEFPTLGTVVDKHSTGGIGDAVTPLFVPIVAACGVPVVKMSGRGLGFTGGTLDKLESIPGFHVDLDPKTLVDQAQRIGCAWGGQTANLAPADKILYALRDATETVESLPLIAASIMSKKLAASANVLILDVKCGSGAFMQTGEEAKALASALLSISNASGRRARAFITDMSQPLAPAVGNALEVKAAFAELRGGMTGRLGSVVMALAEAACDEAGAKMMPRQALDSGRVADKLREWISAQGGDARVVDDPSLLPAAPVTETVAAGASGFVTAFDCRRIGMVARALGAGRLQIEDTVDPSVGIEVLVELGDEVETSSPAFVVHAASRADASSAAAVLKRSLTISAEPLPRPSLVREIQ
jgi:pyrimidine-nucleoside phosphorylase